VGGIRLALIPVLCLALALTPGCMASQPTKFYLLSPAPSPQAAGGCPRDPRITIGICPASLPKYLDRPQIMTRAGPHELRLSELDQWAEPLGDNISRVIAQDLKGLVCAKAIPLAGAGPGETDYRVALKVIRFDGAPGGEAVLEAQWFVFRQGEGTPLCIRESRFTQRVSGSSPEALVKACSSLVASLSSDIAAFFRSIPLPGTPSNVSSGEGRSSKSPIPLNSKIFFQPDS
jgi:uncharacterized protein